MTKAAAHGTHHRSFTEWETNCARGFSPVEERHAGQVESALTRQRRYVFAGRVAASTFSATSHSLSIMRAKRSACSVVLILPVSM